MELAKRARIHTIFKYIFLAAMIAEMLFLSVEALLPGNISSESSGAFGGAVDGLMTDLSDDVIRDVQPTAVSVVSKGKPVEAVTLKSGSRASLALSYSPSSASVNYREAEWSSADESIVHAENGNLYAKSIGETTVTVSLTALPQIQTQISVTVTEVIAEQFTLCFANGSTEISLETGDKALLLPMLFPEPADAVITYESLDPAVAVVEDEIILAVGEGETAIRATYTPQTAPEMAIQSEAAVFVTARTHDVRPIASLAIDLDATPAVRYDGAAAYLYAGDAGTFAAALSPADTTEDDVLWESSDDDILYVGGDGEFEARAKGTVTLTAVSVFSGGVRATCTLEVRNRSLGVKLRLDGAELTPAAGKNTYALTLGAGSRNTALHLDCEDGKQLFVDYGTSDRSVARIYRDGTVAAFRSSADAENGVVTITVRVADNSAFSDENGDLCATYTLLLTVEKQAFSDSLDGWGLFVRKLFGHFGAFLLLGATAAATAAFYDNGSWKRRLLLFAALIVLGFTFACFTELLQTELFTSGRAAAFSDVIIDCNGYMPAAIAVYGVFLAVNLVIFLIKKIRARRRE